MEASKGKAGLLFTILILSAVTTSEAACPSSNSLLGQLFPCFTYVRGSNPPKPYVQSSCCTAVKKLDIACLCATVKSGNIPNVGFQINVQAAVGLPKACNKYVPTALHCGQYTIPPSGTKTRTLLEAY